MVTVERCTFDYGVISFVIVGYTKILEKVIFSSLHPYHIYFIESLVRRSYITTEGWRRTILERITVVTKSLTYFTFVLVRYAHFWVKV